MISKRKKFLLPLLLLIIAILACGTELPVTTEEVDIEQQITKTTESLIVGSPTSMKPNQSFTPQYTATPSPQGFATITANICNLRSGPGTDYSIVGSGEKDDILPVFGKNQDGTWLWIDWKESVWIASTLVNLNVDLSGLSTVDHTGLVFKDIEFTPSIEMTKTEPPEPTPTQAVKLDGIYLLYLSTTKLQFKEYMSYVFGQKINEEVIVGQVMDDGNVALAGKWSEYYFGVYEFCVIVQNVPKNIALSYVKGHSITLEATISRLVGNYQFYWDCKNTLLLSYISSK